MRRRIAAIVLAVAGTPAAAQLDPDAGPVTGEGVLNDHDGNRDASRLTGRLSGGAFAGTIDMTLGDKPMSVTMKNAYHDNGFCVLRGEDGRNRLELRGKCSPAAFGPAR